MDADHPYLPPTSDVSGPPVGLDGGAGGVTHGIVEVLSKTRPWVLFLGVMGLLGCVLMLGVGVVVMFAGALMGAEIGPMGSSFLGAFYVVLSLLYLVPAIHLLRYGIAIREARERADATTVETALRHQLSFWRFVGVLTLAMFGLYIVFIIGAVIAGIANS